MNHNEAVKSYLEYFSKLSEPGFAVMLKGNWGVGKTFFVKEWLTKLKDAQKKHLYVSLYGVTSFDEIETAFFQQIHPRLSSKGVTTVGNMGQLLISAALKYDVIENKRNIFKKKGTTVPEYMVNEKRLIVFDDLERCSIEYKDIMGYINRYVEHHGCNVIIVCNEDEMRHHEKQYDKTKEKVIGRSFAIHPNAEKALDFFVQEAKDTRVTSVCSKVAEGINAIFHESGCNNLRVLKHSIADYKRLIKIVKEEYISNDSLAEHLLIVLMIISYEYKQGELTKEQLSNIESSLALNHIGHSKDFDKTVFGKLVEKYSTDKLHDMLLDGKIWAEIVIEGEINADAINEAIGKSKYFIQDKQPNWVRLWHYFSSSEDEFEETLDAVAKEFSGCVHEEIGVVKHIGALLLRFSKMNLYGMPQDKILLEAKKNIDHLAEIGKLNSAQDNSVFDEDEAWGGLGFNDRESSEFKELCTYIREKREESLLNSLPRNAITLLLSMSEDTQLFHDRVMLRGGGDHDVYSMPVMAYIPVKDFVFSYLALTPDQQRTVLYALQKRFQYSSITEKTHQELEWLKSVVQEMSEYRVSMKDGLNRRRLETLFIPKLREILASRESD